MNLLLVIWSLDAGGAERVMSTLANEWVDRHHVTLMTLDPVSSDHYDLAGEVVRLRYERRATASEPASHSASAVQTMPNRFLSAPRAVLKELRILRQLRAAMRIVQPDVIVSFMTTTNNRVLLASRGIPTPVVVSERVDPRQEPGSMTTRLTRRLMYRYSRAVVVQTQAVKSWAEEYVSASAIQVIPNPVRVVSQSARSRRPVVLAVGRLTRQKGFDILIEAFAVAAADHADWSLQIAGVGPEQDDLAEIAVRLGVGHRVDFLGLVSERELPYGEAGFFALSSRFEGFPNALLEAMSQGCACVATNCPSGPAEIITDGEDGLLVPIDDSGALAITLGRLMNDAGLRQLLGNNAADTVQRFSVSSIVAEWEELFHEVTRPIRNGRARR